MACRPVGASGAPTARPPFKWIRPAPASATPGDSSRPESPTPADVPGPARNTPPTSKSPPPSSSVPSPRSTCSRGQNLGGATPSYYAASIIRGVEVQLLKVTNGQVAVLGTVKLVEWMSGRWVTVTVRAEGDALAVRVHRGETNEYLSPDGKWTRQTVAAIEARDASIRSGGLVGFSRPASRPTPSPSTTCASARSRRRPPRGQRSSKIASRRRRWNDRDLVGPIHDGRGGHLQNRHRDRRDPADHRAEQ